MVQGVRKVAAEDFELGSRTDAARKRSKSDVILPKHCLPRGGSLWSGSGLQRRTFHGVTVES